MKKTLILLLLLLLCINVIAQKAKRTRMLGVDVRLSTFQIETPRYAKPAFSGYLYEANGSDYVTFLPNNRYRMYRVEVNYPICRLLRVGLWSSYGYINYRNRDSQERIPRGSLKTHIFGGGVKASTHLLPLLFEKYRDKAPRVDFYASAELGGFYFRHKWMSSPMLRGGGNTTKAIATVGGGVFFYIWDGLGVYFDYQYGGFLTKKTLEESRAVSVPKVGLTFRF
ncbi:MAG: hypothetical protein LBU91_00250 [Bacteroidales bacterium]|nr:hypothetical protein [Bacteroidales bacterium]